MSASLEHSLSQIRNLIVPRGYGGLFNDEETDDQVIATGAAQKLETWVNAGDAGGGVTVDLANNQIVVGNAGTYLVGFFASFSTSGAAHWHGHVTVDGVSTGIGWERNVAGAGGPGSASCLIPVVLAAGAVVAAAVNHDQGGDVTFTHESGQLLVARIG